MRIAIVDDNREDREHLRAMLEQYCSTRDVTAEIIEFSSGDKILEIFIPGYFQCVFLDIYMEGLDGMMTAREIYSKDPSCRLIFSTISISHAVTSYEVRAAWYLTKPYSFKRLTAAMDAACLSILKNSRTLSVHVNGSQLNIRFGDIFFMDCENKRAKLHLRERILQTDENISILSERLSEDSRFLTCNRNTIVNMEHIELVEEHDFYLKNGDHVPLRQRGRAALKKEYLTWTLRDLRREEHL